jgi:dephospho-CoA kinase
MKKIGLTGNIGSGKSTVAKVFETLGVPVFHADAEAKNILSESDVIEELIHLFGIDILDGNLINRAKLASIVFNDKNALASLNSIVHPRVRKALLHWMETRKGHSYIIQEAAILFESGFNKFFDKTILVSCPQAIAIKRVMERDGVNEMEIKSRLHNQWPEKDKIPLADFTIVNDGSCLVIPQILTIHKGLVH